MNMDSETFNLSRNDFQNSSSDAIKLLKQDTAFLDVTLACEDGKQVKAHKVVLSSFSSVFQTILKDNPHNHPLIYLTGINHEDIEKILDFIYLGEAIVSKYEFVRFMEVAKKLKINGLIEYKDNQSRKHGNDVQNILDETLERKTHLTEELKEEEYFENLTAQFSGQEEISIQTLVDVAEDFSDQNCKRKNVTSSDDNSRKFPCDECEYSAAKRSNLKVHVLAKHKGVKFPCHVCEYKGSSKGNTAKHMKNIHSL